MSDLSGAGAFSPEAFAAMARTAAAKHRTAACIAYCAVGERASARRKLSEAEQPVADVCEHPWFAPGTVIIVDYSADGA